VLPIRVASTVAVVSRDLEGPLDRAVRMILGASWTRARHWIASGKVRVGGAVATDPVARLRSGDEITISERAPKPPSRALQARDVVFVDTHLVVVSKPSGLSTVPFDAREGDTLESRVRRWLQSSGRAPRGPRPNLGVVHRLDKETSGLLAFTRTWLAKKSLASQFRHHTVHRKYLAIARGELREARTLRSFLIPDRGDGRRGSARGRPPPEAREAITHVEPVQPLRGATLVACRLETGRTHQIRIHLSEAGHPLAGERVYVRGRASPRADAPRVMLHAAELGFVHPASLREVLWKCPMPDDMRELLERLRR
jgi:23S rRNA pseudouridine1911/1915/1917 synthase